MFQTDKDLTSIFERGSRTYFFSSMFFSNQLRDKVTRLYAFVRSADDFVDLPVPDATGFLHFEAEYRNALKGQPASSTVIKSFINLMHEVEFNPLWVDAFLDSMRSDLTHQPCERLSDTEHYMYGSAEVIGLMMCRIMGLEEDSHPSARLLGKAMQYINFVRDIEEDRLLGRRYLPTEEIRLSGLSDITEIEAKQNPLHFSQFISCQVDRFLLWLKEAESGYHFIPPGPRTAIATAADMYKWTALSIKKDPMIIFHRKVKPSRARIMYQGARNYIKYSRNKDSISNTSAI
jgi:phytoene synthase